ncbi:MAG: hypothetical protein AB7G75_03830 [Candidatus Binatia bacterium]
MAEKSEGNKEKIPARRSHQPKDLAERLEGMKDSTLRLTERSHHLQEHIGQLEKQVKTLSRLILAVLLGSLVLIALVVGYWLPQIRKQLADVRMSMSQPAPEETAAAVRTRITTEVTETIKKLAPEILATASKEEKFAVPLSDTPGTPIQTGQSGMIIGPDNQAFRVVVGRTDPKQTAWEQYNDSGIYVDIDTSTAGFSSTPYYFTSLGGHTNNWMAQGVTSIYEPTAKGFRVHVGHNRLTAAKAEEWGWYINWIAIGE